jgi:hypothetical protein
MALTNNLKKLVHRKTPEFLTPNPAGNTVAGAFLCSDKSDIVPGHDSTFYVAGVSAVWKYTADEDGWQQLPNSGAAGTFGAGACGEYRAVSAPLGIITQTPTAGTTSTITTSLTITSSLAGKKILIVAGPNAGLYTDIISNTIGANSVITVATQGAAFTTGSLFRIYAGSLWFFNSGAGAVGFTVYDIAQNTWSSRNVTGLPTTFGTDGQLVSTGALMSNDGDGFDTGTATAGAGTTLTCGTKTWPTNGWTNYEVRILSGTGAGQIRTVASNTGTVLTVSAAWTTNPDATSVFGLFGNSDHFYLLGNNAVTMYRYTISTNTWATLAPVAARAGAAAAGFTADWIDNVQAANWNDGSYGAHNAAGTILRQNGRYIYSFRGGSSNVLDVYDIAANTWISGVPYGGQNETFTTGSHSCDIAGKIYYQKEATGRIFVFDVAANALFPFTTSPMPQGTAVVGDKMMIQTYTEGATSIRWLYSLGHTRAEFTRWLIV